MVSPEADECREAPALGGVWLELCEHLVERGLAVDVICLVVIGWGKLAVPKILNVFEQRLAHNEFQDVTRLELQPGLALLRLYELEGGQLAEGGLIEGKEVKLVRSGAGAESIERGFVRIVELNGVFKPRHPILVHAAMLCIGCLECGPTDPCCVEVTADQLDYGAERCFVVLERRVLDEEVSCRAGQDGSGELVPGGDGERRPHGATDLVAFFNGLLDKCVQKCSLHAAEHREILDQDNELFLLGEELFSDVVEEVLQAGIAKPEKLVGRVIDNAVEKVDGVSAMSSAGGSESLQVPAGCMRRGSLSISVQTREGSGYSHRVFQWPLRDRTPCWRTLGFWCCSAGTGSASESQLTAARTSAAIHWRKRRDSS